METEEKKLPKKEDKPVVMDDPDQGDEHNLLPFWTEWQLVAGK